MAQVAVDFIKGGGSVVENSLFIADPIVLDGSEFRPCFVTLHFMSFSSFAIALMRKKES